MAQRMQYVYEYLDASYPADMQAKLDARTADGFVRADSNLAHPYLFVLWERPWPKEEGKESGG
jgi:hypothetical protein